MGDLTENFSRSEFECKCNCDCGYIAADFELVNVLQSAVDYFENKYNQRVSCEITGGNRCPRHNKDEGGSEGSKHQFCIAVDHKFKLKDSNHYIDPVEVAEYYESQYPDKYGIGIYDNRNHLDVRHTRGRWTV